MADTNEQTTGVQEPSSTPTTPTQASTSTTSSQASAAPPAQSTGFTYQEDRSRWIPPHRFNEVSERARRTADLESQIQERDRKIAALAGVTPSDPNAEKSEAVKQAFFQMFPQFKHLAQLNEDQIKTLISTPEKAERAGEIEKREWARHGKQQMTALYSSVADVIGAETLTQDQQDDLRESFGAWFKRTCSKEFQESGGQESATLQRYEEGDSSLLNEFVKRYTANWVEPARRRVTQQTLTRTKPVPNSQGRAQVTGSKRPEKFNSLDERIDYAAKLFEERSGSSLRK